MSVIGIDFGDESCYIAVARQGGIETLANDYSLRATSSCVAFTSKNRVMGVAAKNQTTTNMKNTVSQFKKLIGAKFKNPSVQQELKYLPYTVVETSDGRVGIKVRYMDEDKVFTPTDVTAMLFTKLKLLAEASLGIKVNDVVIGVPSYFDDVARHALMAAAHGAGLHVLRLFNETTATALAYGIYKQDLPATEEKPRNVIFVDCGFSSLQVSAVAFNKGKLKMLATTFDSNLGGRDFDRIIAHHLSEHFKKTFKVDATTNKKAFTKLLTEVEKLKKQMSANSTTLPVNIECFMDDKDVSGRMNRAEFEELAQDCFKRVEVALRQCLEDSQLSLEDIHSVEIVGGSSRVPSIKTTIEKVFKKSPSTTLNQDEAVARGCALQCAMISPTFKVREFSVQDVQAYGVKLMWNDENGQQGEMEVFPKNHQVPFSKVLTFHRRTPLSLQAEYDPKTYSGTDKVIGLYNVGDIEPSVDGSTQKVKVKVRVNPHGVFLVATASLTKKEAEEVTEEVMETEEPKKDAEEAPPKEKAAGEEEKPPAAATEEGKENSAAPPEETKKPKKVHRTIDLPVSINSHAFTTDQLNLLFETESKLAASDKLENERINAKNAVEEYVYDLRSKLCEELQAYVQEDDSSAISIQLEDTENWLYEDGEDCAKQVYLDKLEELRKKGEPIKERRNERLELPRIFDHLNIQIQLTRKVCELFRAGDEKYSHLDEAEVEKVEKAVQDKHTWSEAQRGLLNATSNFKTVPVTCSQVKSELQSFESLVKPILNKPKPKPKAATPPPTETKAPDANGTDAAAPASEGGAAEGDSSAPAKDSSTAPPEASQAPMDVD